MGWPTVELGEVASLIKRPVTPVPGTAYRQIGVRLWGQGAYERATVDGADTKYASLYEVHEGDIVANKIWARNGSVSIVSPELSGCFGSPEFPTYAIDPVHMMTDWFGWFTRSPALWTQCEHLSKGTSGQNRLRPERFLSVRIPLPSLDEQRRIVDRLDRAADLVERRRHAMAASERDIAALLRKAFNEITEGADYLPMAKVAPLVRRPVDVQPDESYPELGVRSFGRGTFHKPALEGVAVGSKKLYRIEPQDLVFNIVFAWEGAVAIAQAKDEGRVGSHRFLTCVPDPEIATVDFLLYFLLTPEGLRSLGEASPGGAGRNRTLGLKKLAALEVPIPPIERQRWFDGLQAKARALRKAHAETAKDLDTLIPAMLHEVFSGDSGRQAMRPSMG